MERDNRGQSIGSGVTRRDVLAFAAIGLVAGASASASAAGPEGQLTWDIHVSLAPAWFDPADTQGIITPYGGHADVTLRRCAKWGDGWMPLAYPPGEQARSAIPTLQRYAEQAGRDPASIGIDTRVSAGAGSEAEWRDQLRFWKSIGVTHLRLANYYESGHLHRIAGQSMSDHMLQ